MDRRDGLFVISSCAALVAILSGAGWTIPWINPDTAGYAAVAPYPEFYSQQRLPFYGWLVSIFGRDQSSFVAVVWLQLVLHVGAASLLYVSVRRLTLGRAAAVALFLAALLSQSFLIFGRAIAPEALGGSLLVIAMALTLLAVAGTRWKVYLALAAMAAAAACLLRPILLPVLVTLPLLFALASRITGRRIVVSKVAALLLLSLAPLLIYAADRARHTGDIKLVAHGGFQMSAMAGLMLSPEIAQTLPEPERALATQILNAREQAEAAGRVLRTPVNSTGERSFVSAAVGYFDIYARTHDDLLYGEIVKLKRPDESWPDFDRRLQSFALATIMHAPGRYAAWIVGASARLVGRMTVTNAPFVLASLALLAMLVLLICQPDRVHNLRGSTDTLLVVAIATLYVLTAAPLAVLITFPASRYIDAAAVLLPALPLFGAIRIGAALMAGAPPRQASS